MYARRANTSIDHHQLLLLFPCLPLIHINPMLASNLVNSLLVQTLAMLALDIPPAYMPWFGESVLAGCWQLGLHARQICDHPKAWALWVSILVSQPCNYGNYDVGAETNWEISLTSAGFRQILQLACVLEGYIKWWYKRTNVLWRHSKSLVEVYGLKSSWCRLRHSNGLCNNPDFDVWRPQDWCTVVT